MTKKHFAAVAATLKREWSRTDSLPAMERETVRNTLRGVVSGLSDTFAQTNPRFDRSRFHDAIMS